MYRKYRNVLITGLVSVLSLMFTDCQSEEAIRAFTLDAAFAAFMEEEIGSLEVGKRADFIVLEQDITVMPEDGIFQIVVEQTWLDGKPVFVRK